MKITALEEYGLRCLVQIARSHARDREAGGDPAPMAAREIAEREGLTVEYVTQLLVRLRRAGLVTSVRGARGGFLLARPAAETTMGDVIRSLGEPLLERLCTSYTGTRSACVHEGGCGILEFWSTIADQVHGVLDGWTLRDLARTMSPAGAAGAIPGGEAAPAA